MYVADHFALNDDDIAAILSTMGAGDLITVHDEGPDATFLPFQYEPEAAQGAPHGRLLAHVARNNTQCSRPCVGPSLVIVHGGDHYVSPSYFPGHDEGRAVVPTWDYITVQAYGRLVVHDDAVWLRAHVEALTERHEAAEGSAWRVNEAPEEYLTRMTRAIVGLELLIERWVGKAKMSQNKTPEDVRAEIAALQRQGAAELAAYKQYVSLPHAIARRELMAQIAKQRPQSLG